ncbi:uncharacterized protein LOC117175039 [Belonocnema kinseyi]|uniref:uncharacterized protein LOC117175039 n=1 Tax=Belonocnema kinseyi TaxID=2817044 RepID=UPI00143D26C5|nr:uncharacterized protein LOC117175039 [Belonocnema kinseyi]
MEEFLRLDWTPKSEDILSDRYVNDERLRNESVTYKILLGSFNNPFSDVRIQNEANNRDKKNSSSQNLKASIKTEPEVSNSTDEK